MILRSIHSSVVIVTALTVLSCGDRTLIPGPGGNPFRNLLSSIDSDTQAFDSSVAVEVPPALELPKLHSLPGAKAAIFLDFNGHVEPNVGSLGTIVVPPVGIDNDYQSFSPLEISMIRSHWEAMAEDFAPFNIDVTTESPAAFDRGITLRVALGAYGLEIFGIAKGQAPVNDFTNAGVPIAWVFRGGLLNSHTASHEAGHALGLQHQSQMLEPDPTTSHGIMYGGSGAGFIWIKGTSMYGATQDDIATIGRTNADGSWSSGVNGFGFRPDDHGDSIGTASLVVASTRRFSAKGIIGTRTDKDYFAFDFAGGAFQAEVQRSSFTNLLRARLELRNTLDAVIASSDSSARMILSANLIPGRYYLVMHGSGNYGELGQYEILSPPLDPPTALLATVVSNTQLDFQWTPPKTPHSGFLIERGDYVGSEFFYVYVAAAQAESGVSRLLVDGLPVCRSFRYRIRTLDGNLKSVPSPIVIVKTGCTGIITPGVPKGLTARPISESQIDLEWEPVANAKSYEIEQLSAAGVMRVSSSSLSKTRISFNLTPATSYSYRVQAVGEGGAVSGFSQSATVTTLPKGSIPISPHGFISWSPTSTRAHLHWWPTRSGSTSYYIVERRDANSDWTQVGRAGWPGFTDVNLSLNTTYTYRLSTFQDGVSSAPSLPIDITTLATSVVPQAPANLKATLGSCGSPCIRLTWADNSGIDTGYSLEQSVNNSSFSVVREYRGTNAGGGGNGVITGISNGAYAFRVRSLNNDGYSEYSNTATLVVEDTNTVIAPSGLVAIARSASQIDLSWTDNSSNEVGFKIERSLDGVAFLEIASTTLPNYSNTALTASTRYYYRVRAYNSSTVSTYSNSVSSTTLALPDTTRPSTPTGLVATAVSASQINLSWTDNSSNEDGFKIERSLDGVSFTEIASVSANAANYSNTGLLVSTKYYYRVRAYNASATSSDSNIAFATTLLPPDTTSPAINISAPLNGATVSGTVSVQALASDNIGVAKIEFYVDSVLKQSGVLSSYALDSTLLSNGTHSLMAKAYDAAGNVGTSPVTSINVSNATSDTSPPNVSIANPANGAVVSRRSSVAITASASDNVGVARVEIYVNGSLICSDTTSPYACIWSVPGGKAGKSYQIQAKAYDAAGNVGVSPVVTVKSQ